MAAARQVLGVGVHASQAIDVTGHTKAIAFFREVRNFPQEQNP